MRHRAATVGLLLVAMVSLNGCFTGKRPSVVSDPFPAGSTTGDPAIDQVLTELDNINPGPYTADYTVLTKFGNVTRPASVAVDHTRRSVTVGTVRFLTLDNNVRHTCLLDKPDPCSTSLDPARISDTQVTPDFYAADAAKRLRRDAVSKIATTVSHIEIIAGQSTTCVDVPLTGGTSIFCVLKGGPLARLDDAAVSIHLTQFSAAADETLFNTSK
jgi:hypothetical protein